MEFKDIIDLFRRHARAFWTTTLVCVALGIVFHFAQKDFVVSNLTLNITRAGAEQTTDYQYHDFYRLQADERFADTVVRWLSSPRIVEDIYAWITSDSQDAERLRMGDERFRAFKAERLSSQMIQVTYKATGTTEARAIARSLIKRVNEETDTLNKDQQEVSWFVVVGDEPVAIDGKISLAVTVAIALALGIFLGFWTVLVRHYFTSVQKEN